MGVYESFRTQVEEKSGEWVEYAGQFKTWHSAQSVANQLRRRFPSLEFKCEKGVIRARTKQEVASDDAA